MSATLARLALKLIAAAAALSGGFVVYFLRCGSLITYIFEDLAGAGSFLFYR